MKDFFTAYHRASVRKYTSSLIVALTLSVAIVGGLNQMGPRSMLLANVLEAGSQAKVDYTADLMVERSGADISLRIGKDAYDVDTLTLTLLGNPERFLGLTSTDPDITITSSESGVSLVTLHKNKAQFYAGDIITHLHATLSDETEIAPVDPVLTSAGQSYALTIKWGE